MANQIMIGDGIHTVTKGKLWVIHNLPFEARIVFFPPDTSEVFCWICGSAIGSKKFGVFDGLDNALFLAPLPLAIPEGTEFQFVVTDGSLIPVEETPVL